MASNDEIKAAVDGLTHELRQHISDETAELKKFVDAFPDGDMRGHRAAHEAMIASERAKERFYQELRLDIAKKGLWGLLVIIIGLVSVGGLFAFASKLGIAATVVKP